MKTKAVFIIFTITLVLTSCAYMIKSLHPFYKKQDITFNKELLGKWIDVDSTYWIFNQRQFKKSFTDIDPVKSNSYELIAKDSAEGDSYFNVFLFTIKGETYFDFFPVMDKMPGNKLADWHMIPVHSLAKVKIWGNRNISFFWYGEEWFSDLSRKNKLKISYETIKIGDKEDEEMNILTSSTDQLQKFIIKFGKEKIYDSLDLNLVKTLNEPEKIANYIQKELDKKDDVLFPSGIKNIMLVNLRKIE
jgi:hypothetical protein